MSDLNDLNRPVPTDTEPNVLDTLRAHIVRAATWSGWGSTANRVAGLMSAVTAAVSGGRSLRLYRRNDANTADEEVVSLPGVSVGGNAATATALETARTINGTSFAGTANITTAQWGTARTITIGATARSVDGSGNVTWTLTDIGAPSTTGTGASGTWSISINGNAATASALNVARTINGTSFNGSGNITTVQWGTARTVTIGATAKSVDGSANVSWTLTEIGAPSTTGSGASGTWNININGSAGSVAWSNVSGRPTAVSQLSNDAGYITSAAINTTNVMAAVAGAAAHGIGTYTDAVLVGGTPSLDTNYSGSQLRMIPPISRLTIASVPADMFYVAEQIQSLPGIWKCMSTRGDISGSGFSVVLSSFTFKRVS